MFAYNVCLHCGMGEWELHSNSMWNICIDRWHIQSFSIYKYDQNDNDEPTNVRENPITARKLHLIANVHSILSVLCVLCELAESDEKKMHTAPLG